MKKVGICACYNSKNYGSMLQAYATQVAIERLGYSSEYIVYRKKKDVRFIIKQLPRLLNKNLLFDKALVVKKKLALKMHPEQQRNESIREKAFIRFQKNYYGAFSEPYYGFDQLSDGANNYSTVLVGSDQLWTPGGLATNFYNLMFVPDEINKVSYATSFGVSSIPWYQTKRTRQYLKRINHISVREIKGAEIVKSISGRNAEVVADPTLLLTSADWNEKVPEKRIVGEPYIFCYFLGENIEHRRIALNLQKQTGLKIVCTPFLDSYVSYDERFGDYQLFDIGPDDFINLIRGAKYILTDSFHGSVFSIIHHKKFIILDRFLDGGQSRNSRIDSLCNTLGLQKRRFDPSVDILTQIESYIDYEAADQKQELLRAKSLEFLRNSICNSTSITDDISEHCICNSGECTGCATCVSECPQNAISMRLDTCGFWRPIVDQKLCIGCNRCNNICPINKGPELKGPTSAYAFQNFNDIRFNSTSGGFFNALASKIIEEGGIVCGAAFDSDMVLRHRFVDKLEDLDPLQRSKYVQSSLEGVFKAIKGYLAEGRKVLFAGVGCQVAGLRNYIGENANLITLDVICYGVPSSGLFHDWIKYLNNKYGKVIDVRFRDKSYGYSSPNVKVIFDNGKFIESCRDSNMYTDLYFRHLSIRESCYHCHFKTVDRSSDITLGDLWSIGKYDQGRDDNKGTTVVFPHTDKGKMYCEKICQVGLDVNEIVSSDARKMVECVSPGRYSNEFWKVYQEDGFETLISQYMRNSIKTKTKYGVKTVMNKMGVSSFWYKIKNK